MFVERAVADHDTGGVYADVSRKAFEFGGVAPELLIGGAAFDEFLQLGLRFVLVLEFDVGFCLDHFRDPVALAVGNPHHAADVAQHALRAQLAVGDDVRNAAFAVFLPHVVDDFHAAALAEVDIDVGRADAFRIEEPFKQQAEAHRADVGDAHGVRCQRAGRRSTAGADRDVVVARPLDEVGGDEEVGGEAQLVDGVDLVFQAGGDFFRLGFFLAVALHESVAADLHQVFLARAAVWGAELRVLFRAGGIQFDGDIAALGDFQCCIAGAGHVGEDLAHLLGGLEIDFRRVVHAVFIDHQVPGADADHHVVGFVVELVEKVHVVRGDDLEVHFPGELEQGRGDQPLRFEAVVVDLDVGVFLAVDFHDFGECLAGFLLVTGAQPLVDRAGNAAGEADDALGILAQGFAVHAGLAVVETFEIPLGDEFAEIVPAFVVFGQQRHVRGALAAGELLFVLHLPRGEVDLAAEDRFHPGLVAFLIEFDRAVEVAVVGHRHGRHSEFLGALGEILDADHAVEQGEFSVQVEVDEGIGHRAARH